MMSLSKDVTGNPDPGAHRAGAVGAEGAAAERGRAAAHHEDGATVLRACGTRPGAARQPLG